MTTQAPIAFVGLFTLLFLVGLLLGGVVFLVWGLVGYRDAGGDDAKCGQCGYIVRGLERLICHECGSDLREVGIVTAGARKIRVGMIVVGLMMICVSLLLFLGGMFTITNS